VQSDVLLISSNAMQYNAPETVYHKQVLGDALRCSILGNSLL